MSPSSRLRVADVRAVSQLVGECRELGDDPFVWRRHFFVGIGTLAGAGVVMGGEVAGIRAGGTRHIGLTDWGWKNGFNRVGWERAMAEMSADPSLSRTPAVGTYFERMKAADGISLSRADILRDHPWYRSWDYENLHRAVGIDHTLWCWRSVPGTADEYNGLLMGRPPKENDFSPRQKALVREALALVNPLVGGALARFAEPPPSALSPRVRQTLRCLLDGDSDKQIAARLGLSWHTVNQYTKAIFAHYGVSSRTELLARWTRRGWGDKCAWADPVRARHVAQSSPPTPSGPDLTPRAQQTLECLLEGDSDKQVARRLGLSRYTVNQYTKMIYAHFSVSSRAELLARWIRRGWGNNRA